jgi:hypothetical protein
VIFRVVCVDRYPVNIHTQNAKKRLERADSLPQPWPSCPLLPFAPFAHSQTHTDARIIVSVHIACLPLASLTASCALDTCFVCRSPRRFLLNLVLHSTVPACAWIAFPGLFTIPLATRTLGVLSGDSAGTAPLGNTCSAQLRSILIR